MKIYTKTGDDGSTGLYSGIRISKDSWRIEALGDVDELNASLGVALCFVKDPAQREVLQEIQRRLFDIGAELANPNRKPETGVTEEDIGVLESSIDSMTEELPPLKAFVLPGGSEGAAFLHLARTVCRRAERSIVELHRHESVRLEARIYINRLSDWLFTAARGSNSFDSSPEIQWRPREKSRK